MFWFIVLLLVVGAGFYFYQKMMAIEREIRAEQVAANEHVSPVQESEPENSAVDAVNPTAPDRKSSPAAAVQGRTAIEEAVISAVAEKPGIKQTDLYLLFTDTSKKQLQKLIKNMSDNGVLRREKQGSSYSLYCV